MQTNTMTISSCKIERKTTCKDGGVCDSAGNDRRRVALSDPERIATTRFAGELQPLEVVAKVEQIKRFEIFDRSSRVEADNAMDKLVFGKHRTVHSVEPFGERSGKIRLFSLRTVADLKQLHLLYHSPLSE